MAHFDFTLVDFFFIDPMLNVGGAVAFDDANWPAIRKVCRFVKTNLAYSVLGAMDGLDSKPSLKRRLLEHLLRREPFRRLAPDRDPGSGGPCVAFRKGC